MDKTDTDNILQKLKNAIYKILREHGSNELSDGTLKKYVSTIVKKKQGKKLYNQLKQAISNHTIFKVKKTVLDSAGDNFLGNFNRTWLNYQETIYRIHLIFSPLDEQYARKSGVMDSYQLGTNMFTDQVIRWRDVRDHLVQKHLVKIYTGNVRHENEKQALRKTCQILMILRGDSGSAYDGCFMMEFLQQCCKFYKEKSDKFLATNDESGYVQYLEHQLTVVQERIKFYLDGDTAEKLGSVFYTIKWVYINAFHGHQGDLTLDDPENPADNNPDAIS